MSIKAYHKQGVDLKRLVLVIGKKIWIVAAAAVIGAALGALLYQGITSIINGEEEYRISVRPAALERISVVYLTLYS